jgi:hypothetical protein
MMRKMTGRAACRTIACCALAALLLGLSGCSGYQLQGVVVEGPDSSVQVVSANDERLSWPAVSGARVTAVLDPESLGRDVVGQTMTGYDGKFSFPIDEVGAGLLEYEVSVMAEASGKRPAVDQFLLPGSGKRVLIMMAGGRGRLPSVEEPAREAEREIEQFYPR